MRTGWPESATTDPKQIWKWWRKHPHANIGGTCDGKTVFDIDPRNGGHETWQRLVREGIITVVPTATHRTGGGWHYIYSDEVDGGKAGQGIDIKSGANKYVVLPGSTHQSGNNYELAIDADPIPLPADWRALVTKHATKRAAAITAHTTTYSTDTTMQAAIVALTAKLEAREHAWRTSKGKPVLRCACPFHEETQPSCDVSLNDEWFHCFGCGAKGKLDVLAAHLGIEWPLSETRKAIVATYYAIEQMPWKGERGFGILHMLRALLHRMFDADSTQIQIAVRDLALDTQLNESTVVEYLRYVRTKGILQRICPSCHRFDGWMQTGERKPPICRHCPDFDQHKPIKGQKDKHDGAIYQLCANLSTIQTSLLPIKRFILCRSLRMGDEVWAKKGIGKIAAVLYFELLDGVTGSARRVAQQAGIPERTAQNLLISLGESGLAAYESGGRGWHLGATSVEDASSRCAAAGRTDRVRQQYAIDRAKFHEKWVNAAELAEKLPELVPEVAPGVLQSFRSRREHDVSRDWGEYGLHAAGIGREIGGSRVRLEEIGRLTT